MATIKRFSHQTGKTEEYVKVEILESVEIKKENFEVLHEYYKRVSDGELFEPFENPDKNLEKDYDLYRKKFAMLSPNEVKEIRNKYELSIRDFSSILGISYSNLSSIENGSIQAPYIDNLLRLSSDPYAFLKLVENKQTRISEKVADDLIPLLHKLVVDAYPQHKQIAEQIKKESTEIVNQLKRLINVIEYQPSDQLKQESEDKSSWTQSIKKRSFSKTISLKL